ncbi:hypothetical protein CVT25_006998 [Psilocybe cyanescens]|uniref:Uncharacterized protein n=1 Tax=Psilocybe cyanescens TaxID=93625 RepID=A0A409WYA7_PSICY|nr:hypothetical protein CVT25_006998 [Psilocybe cyanescens]
MIPKCRHNREPSACTTISVAKIPLIIILTYTFHMVYVPPNSPPSKEELVETSKVDMINGRSFVLKTSLARQASILSLRFPK